MTGGQCFSILVLRVQSSFLWGTVPSMFGVPGGPCPLNTSFTPSYFDKQTSLHTFPNALKGWYCPVELLIASNPVNHKDPDDDRMYSRSPSTFEIAQWQSWRW